MSQVEIVYGRQQATLKVSEGRLVKPLRPCPGRAVANVSAAVRDALEHPLDFPPLRRAITPDDRIVVLVREDLAQLPVLLTAVLDYLKEAGIGRQQVTVLCPDRGGAAAPPWQEQLPPRWRRVAVEVHQPGDAAKISYLASTRGGRRIYLNRSVIDADQVIVLGRLRLDRRHGCTGGATDIFPAMSDATTLTEFAGARGRKSPRQTDCGWRDEAKEVAWLLGVPFFVGVIEGHGEDLWQIMAGPESAVAEAGEAAVERLYHVEVSRSAALVVVGLSGEPARTSFADLVAAYASAARVVEPGGSIAVLSELAEPLPPIAECLAGADNPVHGVVQAQRRQRPDTAIAWELASAAERARLYLLSRLPNETVEDLFLIPLDGIHQVQKLIDRAESCLFLPDGHRVVVEISQSGR